MGLDTRSPSVLDLAVVHHPTLVERSVARLGDGLRASVHPGLTLHHLVPQLLHL